MLGLVASGALLFCKELSLEQAEKRIDAIKVDPSNPEYIKYLAKQILEVKQRVNLNTKAILSTGPVIATETEKAISWPNI